MFSEKNETFPKTVFKGVTFSLSMSQITLYEYGEWTSLPIDVTEEKEAFLSFVEEVWQNRSLPSFPSDKPETEQQIFSIKGNQIRAKNYVGFIKWQNLEIEILPKFTKDIPIDKSLIWEHIFYYFSFSTRLNFPFSWSKSYVSGNVDVSFLELLIAFFCQSLNDYLQKNTGIQYEVREGESPYLRGRLDVTSYTKKNLSTGKWDKIRYQYQPLVYDNLFNQILKFTITQLQLVSTFHQNQSFLTSLSHQFELISTIPIKLADFEKINTTEKSRQHILEMCKYFFLSQKPSSKSGKRANISVLLPMEMIFEDFIANLLKESFPQLPIQIQQSLFVDKNQLVQIRPDILFGKSELPIDSKYKLNFNNLDVYQILTYILAFEPETGILIYPQFAFQETTIERIKISSSDLQRDLTIKRIKLHIVDHSIEELKTKLSDDLASILTDFLN